jgi:riboflavin kinase / FMN adenylyltransferase
VSHAIDLSVPPGFPASHPGTVVTVGTFDGVHRGHWEVLAAVRQQADHEQLPAVLVTFHPHPLRVVRPDHAPRLLTTPVEKKEILAESGLDYAVFLPFNDALRGYAPERFVREILIGRLRMRHLVIGYDHGFGRDRSGDVATLRQIGRRLGFDVEVVPPVQTEGAEPVSSSRVRDAVAAGDVALAARGLGRPYSLTGTVVRGAGRGRKLGFPTANIEVASPDKLLPHEGIYAVRAALGDHFADGVLHLGPRPTFAGMPPSIELHLFDYSGNLYGRRIRVEFHGRVRDIARFDSADALIRAMEADCAEAQRLLAG